jgi:hypothetical protein
MRRGEPPEERLAPYFLLNDFSTCSMEKCFALLERANRCAPRRRFEPAARMSPADEQGRVDLQNQKIAKIFSFTEFMAVMA